MSASRCNLLLSICLLSSSAVLGQQRDDAHHPAPRPPGTGPSVAIGNEVSSSPGVGQRFTEPPSVPIESAPSWIGAHPIGDESGTPCTLDVLLSLAAQNNPTIRQAQLQINGELARAMQAGLYPNPIVSYASDQVGEDGTAGEWQGAKVQQRFVTAGKLALSRSKYLQRARVAEHLAVAQQFRVCNDVRVHFVKSLAALQILGLRRELLKTAEDNILTMREMYNLGQANQADAHRANAMLQQRRLQVLQAENDVRRNLVELMALVGLDTVDPPLEGSLTTERELIDFESAYARLIQCSPELMAAYAKLREDAITIDREKVQWVPDLVVSGGSGYNFIAQQTTATAGLSVEIPLFDRNQGTIRQAEADYIRQRGEIRRTQLMLRKDLAAEYDAYLTAYQHVTELESVILPTKREAYRITLESYKDNRAEWPAVLTAQEDYTTTRIEYIGHQQMQRTSEILIDGYLLHGGLTAPSGPLPHGHIDSVPKPR